MAQTILHSGQIDLVYEQGLIRRLMIGETEIVRMIFSSVRDHNWGAVSPLILSEKLEQKKDGFEISALVSYKQNNINFEAVYLIQGIHNKISFTMHGKAISTFLKNRIGICVLHPIKECVGKAGKVVHPDNSIEDFIFTKQISPHQPVKNIRQLEWKPKEEIHARLKFEGDIFEMEDQRNWTDASYKTYCTPLEFPFPVEINSGQEFNQQVLLEVESTENRTKSKKDAILFEWDENFPIKLPQIGLGVSSRSQMLQNEETSFLRKIPIDHLRTDIQLINESWGDEMNKAVNEAKLLKLPLFLCLYLDLYFEKQLTSFLDFVKKNSVQVFAILPVGTNHLCHSRFDEITVQIRNEFPGLKVGAGVNAYYAELNRNRPNAELADFISFMISPQIHAFDELSIIENIEGISEVVMSAKSLYPGKPIWISPITLKQRFNIVATSKETVAKAGELPALVDVRQSSLFTVAWTLGAIKQLTQNGADLFDFYETVGWRGIIQGIFPPEEPDLFPAKANDIFPVWNLLHFFSGAEFTYFSNSANSSVVEGMVIQKKDTREIILVNYTSEIQFIRLSKWKGQLFFCPLLDYPNHKKIVADAEEISLNAHDIMILKEC